MEEIPRGKECRAALSGNDVPRPAAAMSEQLRQRAVMQMISAERH